MADENAAIDESLKFSVQSAPNEYWGASFTDARLGAYGGMPSIYDPFRQAILYRLALNPQNSMWNGAISGLIKEIVALPWEIKGKRRVKYYQDLLLYSDLGAGWLSMAQRALWDFLHMDDGGVIEKIGRGKTDEPLTREKIVGLRALSPLYCYPTGNPIYPIWYQDAENGKLYKMHHTRIVRWIDQPFSDVRLNNRGFSAFSRALTYIQQSMVMNTYIGQEMDNQPPPGVAIWNGVSKPSLVQQMWAKYKLDQETDFEGKRRYAPNAEFINPTNDKDVSLNYVRFASTPENFDVEKYEKIQAAGIARALGIDVQDVLALSSGGFGTGTQSIVLAKKSESKMIAFIIAMMTQTFNTLVFPDNLKFTVKTRNTEKSLSEAQVTDTHVRVAATMAALPNMPPDAHLRYLANNDEAMADILLDANGELIFAYSDDAEVSDESLVPPAQPTEEVQTADEQQGDIDPNAPIVDAETKRINKAFSLVADSFRRRFSPVMTEINEGGIDGSRRADSIVRSILRNEGQKAIIEGLADGGVTVTKLEGKDLGMFTSWWGETSRYITDLISRLWGYGEGRITRSDAEVAATIEMWINKSLRDAYLRGLASADADGMYQFVEGGTRDKCRDCLSLNGQIHRLSTFVKAGAVPGSSKLECKGYRCKCRFRKTDQPERGTIVMVGGKHALHCKCGYCESDLAAESVDRSYNLMYSEGHNTGATLYA